MLADKPQLLSQQETLTATTRLNPHMAYKSLATCLVDTLYRKKTVAVQFVSERMLRNNIIPRAQGSGYRTRQENHANPLPL